MLALSTGLGAVNVAFRFISGVRQSGKVQLERKLRMFYLVDWLPD